MHKPRIEIHTCVRFWRTKLLICGHLPAFCLHELAESNVLTDEGERGGEDEKHAVAVHGERDGKVSRQAAPNEKLVHCCPVIGVQT